MPLFGRICNPHAVSIRILNPISASQMLILNAAELQIRLNGVLSFISFISAGLKNPCNLCNLWFIIHAKIEFIIICDYLCNLWLIPSTRERHAKSRPFRWHFTPVTPYLLLSYLAHLSSVEGISVTLTRHLLDSGQYWTV